MYIFPKLPLRYMGSLEADRLDISVDPGTAVAISLDSCRPCSSKEPVFSVSLCGRIFVQSCRRRRRCATGLHTFHITDLVSGRTCNVKGCFSGAVVSLQTFSTQQIIAVCRAGDVGYIRLLEINYQDNKTAIIKEAEMISCANRSLSYADGHITAYDQGGVSFEVYEAATLSRITHYTPELYPGLENNSIAINDERRYWVYRPSTQDMCTLQIRANSLLLGDVLAYDISGKQPRKPTLLFPGEHVSEWFPRPGKSRNPIDFMQVWRGNGIGLHLSESLFYDDSIVIKSEQDIPDVAQEITLRLKPADEDWHCRGILPADDGCLHILYGRSTLRCVRLDLKLIAHYSSAERLKVGMVREVGLRPLFAQAATTQQSVVEMSKFGVDPTRVPATFMAPYVDGRLRMSPCGRFLYNFSLAEQSVQVLDRLWERVRDFYCAVISRLFDSYFATSKDLVSFRLFNKRCRIELGRLDGPTISSRATYFAAGAHCQCPKIIPANNFEYFFILPTESAQPWTVFRFSTQKLVAVEVKAAKKFGAFRVEKNGKEAVAISWTEKHLLEVGMIDFGSGEYSLRFNVEHSDLGVNCLSSAVWFGDRLFASHQRGRDAQPFDEVHWLDVATGESGEFRLCPKESTPPWFRRGLVGSDEGIFAVYGESRIRCVRIPIGRPDSLRNLAKAAIAESGLEWPVDVERPEPMFETGWEYRSKSVEQKTESEQWEVMDFPEDGCLW